MTSAQKLRDPRWQKKRLKILSRDKWRCKLCKDHKTELQVHHKEYSGEPWEADDKILMTLCKHCHSIVEVFKKENGCRPLRSHKVEFDDDSLMVFLTYLDKNNEKSVGIEIYNSEGEALDRYILHKRNYSVISSMIKSLTRF